MIMNIIPIISHLSAAVERASIYEEHDREAASRGNLKVKVRIAKKREIFN